MPAARRGLNTHHHEPQEDVSSANPSGRPLLLLQHNRSAEEFAEHFGCKILAGNRWNTETNISTRMKLSDDAWQQLVHSKIALDRSPPSDGTANRHQPARFL